MVTKVLISILLVELTMPPKKKKLPINNMAKILGSMVDFNVYPDTLAE